MNIRQMMTPAPATCEPTTTIRIAAQLMADHNCAAIPVTRSGELVGIITDRDIACRAVAAGRNADLAVSDVMTVPVLALAEDDSWDTAAKLMAENHLHHLPVVGAGGRLLGVVAQSDLGRRMTNREFGSLARETSVPCPSSKTETAALIKQTS